MMNCCSKEQIARAGKNQPELLHICPSKLSKRELEDLYFALLQNNLDLKKTLNRQTERVKVLSTKLQRMTATQKAYQGEKDQKDHRDVSTGARHAPNDQKNVIAELKRANDRLTERIRQLNMRLCTAKQYMKRSQPHLAYSKPPRSATSKPSSTSALYQNKSNVLNLNTASVSCQCLHKEEIETKTTGTETNEHEKEAPGMSCDENICKTLMKELKQKIVNLQEELAKSHDEYSTRISRLEEEVSEMHRENLRVRNDQSQRESNAAAVAARLRDAEAKCDDLTANLLIERGKVAELETQMRAAELSSQLAKTIEDHLNSKLNADDKLSAEDKQNAPERRKYSLAPQLNDQSPEKGAHKRPSEGDGYLFQNYHKSDDSGYTDPDRNSDSGNVNKINEELMHRINELQDQLQALKDNAAIKPDESEKPRSSMQSYNINIPASDVPVLKNLKDYDATILDPIKKVILKIEHVNKDDVGNNVEKKRRSRDVDVVKANQRWKGYDVEDNEFSPQDVYPPKTESLMDETKKILNVTQKENEKGLNKDQHEKSGPKNNDEHNKYQIPGPLPVDSPRSSTRKRSKLIVPKSDLTQHLESTKDHTDSDLERMQEDFKENRDTMKNKPLPAVSRRSSNSNNRESQLDKKHDYDPPLEPSDFDIHRMQQQPEKNIDGHLTKQNNHESLGSPEGDRMLITEKPNLNPNNSEKDPVHKDLYLDNIQKPGNKNVDKESIDQIETDPLAINLRRPSMQFLRETKENNPKGFVIESNNAGAESNPMQNDVSSKNLEPTEISPLLTANRKAEIVRKIDNSRRSSEQSLVSSLSFYTRKAMNRRLSETPNRASELSIFDKKDSIRITPKKVKDVGRHEASPLIALELTPKGHRRLESSTSYDDIVHVMDSVKGMSKDGDTVTYLSTKETLCEPSKEFNNPSLLNPPVPMSNTPVQTDRNDITKADGAQDPLDYKNMENKPLGNEHLDMCASRAHVCTCPAAARRDVCVFRTCSGTLRFRTKTSAPQGFRRCKCGDAAAEKSCGTADEAIEPPQSRRASATYNQQQTYTVLGAADVVRCTRATSPENTDHEISGMSDLPSERDGYTNERQRLSLGEHKETSTYTDSGTAPSASVDDYVTLSEGEMPHTAAEKRLSIGETQPKVTTDANALPRVTSSQKMEAALEAIGEELARCRKLLLSQQTGEKPSQKDASAMAEAPASAIALRKSQAKARIGDRYTPKCVFTLHIGTAVLSDEAVINSRDVTLMLSWQFYDQNLAMTRIKPGRVVHFDFSTEYEIKLTDEFLDYMQFEDMAILICELNKQDEPFASCILPLRDALLHTNQRVDMSLALLTGPRMLHAQHSVSSLHAGEELGVLDLWYMLRAEPRLLPRITKSLAKKQPPLLKEENRANFDDTFRLSSDDDTKFDQKKWEQKRFMQSRQNTEREFENDLDLGIFSNTSKKPFIEHPINRNEYKLSSENKTIKGSSMNSATYPSRQDRTAVDLPISNSSRNVINSYNADSVKNQVNFEEKLPKGIHLQRSSGIIINEVPANIRSTNEMKKALNRTYIDPVNKTQWKNVNEMASQPSLMSVRSVVGRRPKDKQKLSLSNAKLSTSTIMNDLLDNQGHWKSHEVKQKPTEESKLTLPREDSDATLIGKKYDNMTKIIGAKKALEVYKRVKLKNKTEPEDSASFMEPVNDELPDYEKPNQYLDRIRSQSIDITVLWLTLNEECEAMGNPNVQRLYVTYTFLGRRGADLETPVSQPKPKLYAEKCFFYYKKTFQLTDYDLPILGRLARTRSSSKRGFSFKDGAVFNVVSEPAEDPLGLNNCEDIGYAVLFFGDLLAYSAGSDSYTEVIPIHSAHAKDVVVGVLAVKVDGLDVVRKCLMIAQTDSYLPGNSFWDGAIRTTAARE